MMRSAPSCFAPMIAPRPTAPSPTTAMVVPGPAPVEQVGDEFGRGRGRGLDQGAVREGDARELGLRPVGTGADEGVARGGGDRAAGGVSRPADLALPAGDAEGSDHEVAGRDLLDGGAGFDDLADVLVAHVLVVDRLGAPERPQVGAADAGGGEFDDRVRRVQDLGGVDVLDDDPPGGFHDYSAHVSSSVSRASTVRPGARRVDTTGPPAY